MKILTKEFTKREKVLIFALIIAILALCYYRFVHIPISEAIAEAEAEQYRLQDEEVILKAQAAEAQKMKEEFDALDIDNISMMPSYNASKQELELLDTILADTKDYSVTFKKVTRSSDQIRRNFSLSFSAGSEEEAKQIIDNLLNNGFRVLVDDLVLKTSTNRYGVTSCSCSLSATFFETMVDGKADAGLPADSAN